MASQALLLITFVLSILLNFALWVVSIYFLAKEYEMVKQLNSDSIYQEDVLQYPYYYSGKLIVLVTCTIFLVLVTVSFLAGLKGHGRKVIPGPIITFLIWVIGCILFLTSDKIAKMNENVYQFDVYLERDGGFCSRSQNVYVVCKYIQAYYSFQTLIIVCLAILSPCFIGFVVSLFRYEKMIVKDEQMYAQGKPRPNHSSRTEGQVVEESI